MSLLGINCDTNGVINTLYILLATIDPAQSSLASSYGSKLDYNVKMQYNAVADLAHKDMLWSIEQRRNSYNSIELIRDDAIHELDAAVASYKAMINKHTKQINTLVASYKKNE